MNFNKPGGQVDGTTAQHCNICGCLLTVVNTAEPNQYTQLPHCRSCVESFRLAAGHDAAFNAGPTAIVPAHPVLGRAVQEAPRTPPSVEALQQEISRLRDQLADACDALGQERNKHAEARNAYAMATQALAQAGYVQVPGELQWKPPVGPSPSPLFKRIDELTAQNSDLRKRWDAAEHSSARWKTVATAYRTAYTPDGHNSPDDCFATGPLTGNLIEDLVVCPGCRAEVAFEEAEAVDKRNEGEEPGK